MKPEGLFTTLFDFSFTRSATLRAVGLLYLLGTIGVTILALVFLVGGLASGGLIAVLSLAIVPLVALAALLWWRITLEALSVLHQIAESTGRTAANVVEISRNTQAALSGVPPAASRGPSAPEPAERPATR